MTGNKKNIYTVDHVRKSKPPVMYYYIYAGTACPSDSVYLYSFCKNDRI